MCFQQNVQYTCVQLLSLSLCLPLSLCLVCVCLSVSLCLCLSLSLSLSLSVSVSISVSVSLCLCLSVSVCAPPPPPPSLSLSIENVFLYVANFVKFKYSSQGETVTPTKKVMRQRYITTCQNVVPLKAHHQEFHEILSLSRTRNRRYARIIIIRSRSPRTANKSAHVVIVRTTIVIFILILIICEDEN